MEQVIAVKNFVTFAIPLSMLLMCKVVLPTSMYESIVNYTADKIFMPPQDNRGMCTMYEKSITPRTFLMWSTSNLQAVKSTFSSMLLELGCTAHVGSSIDEEIEFIEYSTLAPKRLSDFYIPEEEQTTMMALEETDYHQQPKVALEETTSPKPIVINIGSTSWPPYRHEMKHFNSCIVDKYKDAFIYIVLYINEAHPSNGWYIGDDLYKIHNHTSIVDRQQAARYLDDDLHPNVHVLLDNLNNDGQKIFGCKYERLYVLKDGKVLYQGGNGPFGYDLKDLEKFLDTLVVV